MLSVRKSVLFAVIAATVSQGAFANGLNTNALRGSLLKPGAAARFTPSDTERMEAARALLLNGVDGLEVREWVGDGAFKGEFKLEKRYTIKDTQIPAATYIHALRDKTTGQIIKETEIVKNAQGEQTGTREVDVAVRGYVKLENGQWSRYTGDKALLIPATATPAATPVAAPRAEPTASQPVAAARPSAVEQLPPTGAVGPEYTTFFPQLVGRTKLGDIVHSFKVMAIQLSEELAKEKYKDANEAFKIGTAKAWFKARANAWIDPMNRANTYIAVGQLALVIKEVSYEEAKLEVLKAFSEHGRIDMRPGASNGQEKADVSPITTQFNKAELRNEARQVLTGEGSEPARPPRRKRN